METIVRIASLKISNIKNVREGQIIMPNAYKKQLSDRTAEVLGLYGQNGSGKTAIIDTLYFLQQIMTGNPLAPELADYIDANASQAEMSVEFDIYSDTMIYETGYRVILQRRDKGVELIRETLSAAVNEDDARSDKIVCMDYQRGNREAVFLPREKAEAVIAADPENETDLIVARKLAERSNCSYIFGDSSREIFLREYDGGFRDCGAVIRALYEFALRKLFVIRSTHAAAISANIFLPMAVQGGFALPLVEPVVLDEAGKDLLEHLIGQINTVLYTIIPGMRVDIVEDGRQLLDTGEVGHKVELVSVREGIPPIPIRMESEGILKLISILNALIQAFGNPSICLAIDELDAGIFEYMLGELLDIFGKSARGQLIFTSHNLRALEMLDRASVMFSTTNPDRRYIHMNQLADSHNMRDVYLRGITLGGQEEQIYEETDSVRIARAFRKAGRSIRNE